MPEQLIVVAECRCPFCDTEEKVHGFKVQDEDGRNWSYCTGDHSEFQDEFPEKFTDKLWFSWVDEDTVLFEGPQSHRDIQASGFSD